MLNMFTNHNISRRKAKISLLNMHEKEETETLNFGEIKFMILHVVYLTVVTLFGLMKKISSFYEYLLHSVLMGKLNRKCDKLIKSKLSKSVVLSKIPLHVTYII